EHGRANDLATKGLSDCLMAEADAEKRNAVGRRCRNEFKTDTGLVRVARAGGKHDRLRPFGKRLPNGDLVIAVNLRLGPKLAQKVNEIVGKAVVIIDEQQHGEPSAAGRAAFVIILGPAPQGGKMLYCRLPACEA